MKIRIKTFNGELPSYLTVGRVYEVVRLNMFLYPIIFDDENEHITIDWNNSFHLNGGSWEVVSDHI